MAKLIPAAERIARARQLIEKARALPAPQDPTLLDLTYMAQVKDWMRQARDLIKFISYTPSASPEMKREVAEILEETTRVEKELMRRATSAQG